MFEQILNNMNNLEEIWKDIPDYEGYYQSSTLGRVRSLDRYITINSFNQHGTYETKRLIKGKIIKQKLTKFGYYVVPLCKIKSKYHFVHRLVYSTFNGMIPEGMQVNHINEIKSDNRLSNLNLMSCKENINWGTGNVRRKETRNNNKSYHYTRIVKQYDLNGCLIKTYADAKSTGYCREAIRDCCQGKQKTAYGYVWKYGN